jgi:hypothetical protein
MDLINEDKKIFDKYCKKFKYYPPIIPAQKRIIVLGDLHGDFSLTIKLLKLAKVIDHNNNWIGGNTYVVQVGDQLDSCRPMGSDCNENIHDNSEEAEDVKILKFMNQLNDQANEANGAVISLMGNHEIMNAMGNMDYVSKKDIDKFKNYGDKLDPKIKFNTAKEARIHAFKPGNELGKLLGCSRVPALIIGSFIFVHAGIIDQFIDILNIKSRDDLIKITYIIRKWLLGIIDSNNVINIINSSRYSLFWDRILGAIPPNMSNTHPDCVNHLNKVLELFKVDKMIIGHTPQCFANKEGINKTCGDKLWRVDVAGSFGFNKFDTKFTSNGTINELRKAQVLEILDDSTINILK